MITKLWFRLDSLLVLAEHILTTSAHHTNGSGPAGPALVCLTGDEAHLASSERQPAATLTPAFTDHHNPTADPVTEVTLVPLTAPGRDGRTLIDRLRRAPADGMGWVSIEVAGSGAAPIVEFHTNPPAPQQSAVEWAPRLVAIDDLLGPYPAQVMVGQVWNGWAIPKFSLEVVERIAEDTTRLAAGAAPGLTEAVRVVGDRVEIVRDTESDAEDIEVLDADPDGCYPVGAMAWTWSLVDDSAAVCLDECQCGTGCGCPSNCAVCYEPIDAGHTRECPWTAGSARYERPEIPPQPAVLDAHRHRPGCPLVRRRPGPLFDDDFIPECGFCGAHHSRDAHTLRTGSGAVEHHQRCTACGHTWSAAG